MRIKRVGYPVRVLGPGERLGIWVTGCKRQCPGCMTPELQDFAAGREMDVQQLMEAIRKVPGPVEGVTISGGEPFDQPGQLSLLVTLLQRELTDDIIIYTGYTMEQLQARKCPDTDAVLGIIAVLIDGAYVQSLDDGVGLRGSSNQRIHIFRQPQRYAYMESCKRQLQVFNYNHSASLLIGLLGKESQ